MLIRNVDVLIVPEQGECRVDKAQDIHVEDDRIVAITPTSDAPDAGEPPTEVVDGTGLLAVPGLVNSHTHSPMVMMRGAAEDLAIEDWFNRRIWPMEVNLTPERVRVGARLACAEMLLAGVTTFVDHYFHADEIAAAAIESGIRADLAPTFFSSAGQEAIDAAFETTRDLSTRHPRITASLGPHATYTVTDDDLRRTADLARAEGRRIHLHAAETDDQTQASLDKHGVTPIQVLERTGVLEAGALIAHGCGIRAEDLPILERYADRTTVACCPKVYLKLAMGEVTPIKGLAISRRRRGRRHRRSRRTQHSRRLGSDPHGRPHPEAARTRRRMDDPLRHAPPRHPRQRRGRWTQEPDRRTRARPPSRHRPRRPERTAQPTNPRPTGRAGVLDRRPQMSSPCSSPARSWCATANSRPWT